MVVVHSSEVGRPRRGPAGPWVGRMRRIQVPEGLLALASTRYWLVSVRECEEHGVGEATRARLVADGRWRRVTRGVYDVRGIPATELPWRERHPRAAIGALLAYGPDAVAVGTSALALGGVQGLPAQVRPEVALVGGRSAMHRSGVRLRQFDAGMEVVEVGGWRSVSVTWALAQAVPELDRAYAVSLMDSAQQLGRLDADGLARAHDLARGRRGVERTHRWWELSDGRAESPNETRVRLDCLDCGVPPDDLQVWVYDADDLPVGRGDLGWKKRDGRWLMAEVDGEEVHSNVRALFYDRRRQNLFLEHGADTVRFTWQDTLIKRYCGTQIARLLAAA